LAALKTEESSVSNEKRDRELGKDRPIRRRDFLNGMSLAIGASLAAPSALWTAMLSAADQAYAPEKAAGYYPPAKTGMRGSHDGSWEVAHGMRDGKVWSQAARATESYDLIVVGAGVSGLSAAYFYRQQAGPKARILILDNHDDFGGHAKRNEFRSGDRLLIGYGGTQTITGPNLYSEEAKQLFKELGIEVQKFEKYFDQISARICGARDQGYRRTGHGAGSNPAGSRTLYLSLSRWNWVGTAAAGKGSDCGERARKHDGRCCVGEVRLRKAG
jgi:hypothetical protein